LEFERQLFIFEEYSRTTLLDDTYLVLQDPPSTPLYQPSDSEEEDIPTVKIPKSSKSSLLLSPLEDGEETPINHHLVKTGVTLLNKSPHIPYNTQIMSNLDYEEENVEDNNLLHSLQHQHL
jgi:hypothetical protein